MGRVVAVVGGGISGLGAARVLAGGPLTAPGADLDGKRVRLRGDDTADVVLLESDDRFGGKVLSGEFRGRPIDFGPDNFLTRNRSIAELCSQLGIDDDLTSPATSSASVVARGRLHPLPAGLVLGLPPDLFVLARSRIVSARGLARAALDLVPLGSPMSASSLGLAPAAIPPGARPCEGGGPEWSAASILERRLGRELVERLVDPLLGGINAGGLDHLSLTVVAPQVSQALVGHRSITRALQEMMRNRPVAPSAKGAKPLPFFLGMRGGLGRIVAELVADLHRRGVTLRTGTAVTTLRKRADRFELETADGTLVADGVVLAAPGHVSARLLVEEAPVAAAELGSIPHSSVALVTFAWASDAIAGLTGSGFLAPRCEGRIVTGCTYLSAKWPYTAAPGEVVIRTSSGRYGDDRASSMSDEQLVEAVLGELRQLIGTDAPPLATQVQRWRQAFPQYLPGHLGKIERARAALGQLPAIALAGASLGGIGIPACLTSGERAAAEVVDRLGA